MSFGHHVRAVIGDGLDADVQTGRYAFVSLTFALSTNAKNFSTGFPRSPLASADRDAESDVVETYPLELPTAKLR